MATKKPTAEQLYASRCRRLHQLLCDLNDPDIGTVTPAVQERRRILQQEIDKLRAEGVPIMSPEEIKLLPT